MNENEEEEEKNEIIYKWYLFINFLIYIFLPKIGCAGHSFIDSNVVDIFETIILFTGINKTNLKSNLSFVSIESVATYV